MKKLLPSVAQAATQAAIFFIARFKLVLLLITAFAIAVGTARLAAEPKSVLVNFGTTNGPDRMGSLGMSEQSTLITVQVPIENRRQEPIGSTASKPAPDVKNLGLQVWLLKADGSVVTQKRAGRDAMMIGGVGAENWFVMFEFAKVPPDEIVGISFSKNGHLYSQKVLASDWK